MARLVAAGGGKCAGDRLEAAADARGCDASAGRGLCRRVGVRERKRELPDDERL